MKDAIIHDTDNDGIMAAAIIADNTDADLYPVRTYDKARMGEVAAQVTGGRYRDIYMVDLSAPPSLMDALKNGTKRDFFWFDHHQSAQEMFGVYLGAQDVKKSATKLIWEWFYRKDPMPLAVSMTNRYDLFKGQDKKDFFTDVIPIQCFLERIRSVNAYRSILNFSSEELGTFREVGRKLWEDEVEAFEKTEFATFGFYGDNLVLSRGLRNPGRTAYLLRRRGSKKADFYINQAIKPNGLVTHSIRSLHSKADCLEFIKARGFNGGGHPAAAGFSTTTDLFFNQ